MVRDPSIPQADDSLPAVLAQAARRRTDGELVAFVACGVVAVVAGSALLEAGRLVISLAGGATASFGLWGIADRERTDRGTAGDDRLVRVLGGIRTAAAVTGAACAVCAVLAALRAALGTWIS